MTLSLLLLLGQTAPPALILDRDVFVVRGLGKEVREPVVRQDEPESKASYRKDDAFAVWDARGITVRHGSFAYSSKLPEVALTPKLFSKEEIIAHRDAIAKGDLAKDASALSGSRRIADDVFFLVRWDDKEGKPWLEALVKVNLGLSKPKPELVGKFEGMTPGGVPVDDQLLVAPAGPQGNPVLSALVRKADSTWGLATYDRLEKVFGFRAFGSGLLKAFPISSRLVLAMEATDYGKVRVARVDLTTGSRRELAELPGSPAFVDAEAPPLVKVATNLGLALRNLETGVQLNLPDKPVVRRTQAGILVWQDGKPEAAALYSPERFLRLATATKASAPPKPADQAKPAPKSGEQSKPTVRKKPPPT